MRVAFDITPLHGPRSGVGQLAHQLLTRLAARADVDVIAYSVSWRGRGWTGPLVPDGVELVRRPMAGRRLAGSGRYVLALGTVEPRKDLPTLVRAFDAAAPALDEVDLVIAGPDGWGATALAETIDASKHASRIHRIGWVDDQSRADL